MPRDANGDKWACEPCVRGHRSSKCDHYERMMIRVKKPGRPLQQCPHPPNECNCEFDRVMMIRINPGIDSPKDKKGKGKNAVGCECYAKYYFDKFGRRRYVGPNGAPIPFNPRFQPDDDMSPERDLDGNPRGHLNSNAPMRQPMNPRGPPAHPMQPQQGFGHPFAAPNMQYQHQYNQQPAQPHQYQPMSRHMQQMLLQQQLQKQQQQQRQQQQAALAAEQRERHGSFGKVADGNQSNGFQAATAEHTTPERSMTMPQHSQTPDFKMEDRNDESSVSPSGSSNQAACCGSSNGTLTETSTPATSASQHPSLAEAGLQLAGGSNHASGHFTDLATHTEFTNSGALQTLARAVTHNHHASDASSSCICGPGCTCFGCLAHPLNPGTQNSMHDLRDLMEQEDAETPSPTSTLRNPVEQPQDGSPGFAMVGGLDTALAPEPGMPYELTAPPQPPQLAIGQGDFSMSTTANETFLYYYPQNNQPMRDSSMYGPSLYPSGDYACVDPALFEGSVFDTGATNNEFGEYVNDSDEMNFRSEFADDNDVLENFRPS